MPRTTGGCYCAAINCYNNRKKHKNLSFFTFPKDEKRCKKWVQNTRREDLRKLPHALLNRNYFLCAEHFEIEQFMNASKHSLIWCAVPTLFNVPNPPKPIRSKRKAPLDRSLVPAKKKKLREKLLSGTLLRLVEDTPADADTPDSGDSQVKAETEAEGDTPAEAVTRAEAESATMAEAKAIVNAAVIADAAAKANATAITNTLAMAQTVTLVNRDTPAKAVVTVVSTPQKQSLQGKPRPSRENVPRSITVQEVEIDSLDISETAKLFFKSQIQLCKTNRRGYRWSNLEKEMLLGLYSCGAKSYKYLSRIFLLPGKTTLHKWLSSKDDDVVATTDPIDSILEMEAE